ncbi:glycosyltransferase [Dermatobacter hominis]|uniref:glycosyltransferase n=1 Tax=Dermatobacter hominis TaxID=2884263 RepID=UPI001D10682A|nr:glycosyltransferase [Dermatobacter hominis]UDY33924.1 glycosyltransferase [Dermatobacter hominis]
MISRGHETAGTARTGRPAVVGLLVTYRRPQQLAATLAGLAAQTAPPDELLVLDNGDPEPTAAVLADVPTPFPVRHVPLGDNLGPAGALARGARLVSDRLGPGDWVLLLDDDDPPEGPTDLERLREFATSSLAADPMTGAVGEVGARLDRRGRTVRPRDEELGAERVQVDYLGGGVLPMYSTGAVRATGLTDPDLFFGFDDLELGLRLQDAGFHLWAHGPATHRRRERDGRLGRPPAAAPETPWRRYYSTRNLVLVLRRRRDGRGALLAALRALAGSVGTTVRGGGQGLAHLRMTVRGVGDGYRGRAGRRVDPPAPAGAPGPAADRGAAT